MDVHTTHDFAGRLVGQSLDLASGGLLHLNAGMYATLGAAAMLGGVTRMVISLTVILVEATGNIQITLPVMVTLVTARFVGNRLNEGLYDMYVRTYVNGWRLLVMQHHVVAPCACICGDDVFACTCGDCWFLAVGFLSVLLMRQRFAPAFARAHAWWRCCRHQCL